MSGNLSQLRGQKHWQIVFIVKKLILFLIYILQVLRDGRKNITSTNILLFHNFFKSECLDVTASHVSEKEVSQC
jgi:hypothetical protein